MALTVQDTTPPNMLFNGWQDKKYRDAPGISQSALKQVLKSPYKYKYFLDNPEPPTPAMEFGLLLHTVVLQPSVFIDEYAIIPKVDRRTKIGKADYADFCEENKDKIWCKLDDYEKCVEMMNALDTNKQALSLLANADEREASIFWSDESTGTPCKGRIDAIGDYLIDIKTTEDASYYGFMRSIRTYGYDVQAAFYVDGYFQATGKSKGFVFIAIEKKPPYAIGVYQLDEIGMSGGYQRYCKGLEVMKKCQAEDYWPSYTDNISTIFMDEE